MTTYIYALIDPRTRLLRYIGKSVWPRHRWRVHIAEARRTRKGYAPRRCRWIQGLLGVGMEPALALIEECGGNGEAEEIFHIALARADGLDLVNMTDGGDGSAGMAEEVRLRISKANKGKRLTADQRAKIGAAIRGRKQSAEWVAKRTANQRGKRMSDEARRHMSEAKKGRGMPAACELAKVEAVRGKPQSAEHIEKRIAPLRGRPRPPEVRQRVADAIRAALVRKNAAG